MDFHTALSSVSDQIRVNRENRDNLENLFNTPNQKIKDLEKSISDLTNIKKSYIDSFNKLSSQYSSESDLSKYNSFISEYTSKIKAQAENAFMAKGLKKYFNYIINECESLIDGAQDNLVSLDEYKIDTIDTAISKAKTLLSSAKRKHLNLEDDEQYVESISELLQLADAKEQSRFKDIDLVGLVKPFDVIPLGTFSAKSLKQHFSADSKSGYPVIHGQTCLAVKACEETKNINLDEELNKYTNLETLERYVLVSKQPSSLENYYLYWVMLESDLDKLKASAMYDGLMCLRSWSLL